MHYSHIYFCLLELVPNGWRVNGRLLIVDLFRVLHIEPGFKIHKSTCELFFDQLHQSRLFRLDYYKYCDAFHSPIFLFFFIYFTVKSPPLQQRHQSRLAKRFSIDRAWSLRGSHSDTCSRSDRLPSERSQLITQKNK